MPDDNIAQSCQVAAESAADALRWFEANPDQVRQEYISLVREFRKFALAAQKLAAAAARPMCVGVFGPSQAGKSYLISAFARRGTNPLIADFDGLATGLDFVRQINPEGKGNESTGLVTRFTLRRSPTPPGFPVNVRLLSHADIVKIIGNTFFSDCDLSDEPAPDVAQINERAAQARTSLSQAAQCGLTEEDIWDIQDYFERQFKGQTIVRSLAAAGYWSLLAELAPQATATTREALFSLLWGDVPEFTALYAKLVTALDRLGHATEIFCPIEALVARSGDQFSRAADSVIYVGTLNGLRNETEGTLEVRTPTGLTAPISRPILTALIAELRITMHERPWDFLDNTDLLDFPGARSRQNHKDVRAYLKADTARSESKDSSLSGLPDLLLRGKVAYLFERYTAEQELTGMMLCLRPEQQEVQILPSVIKEWIDLTHGPDPQTRNSNETALFLVLTRFDELFKEGIGDDEDSTARWTRVLEATLIGFLGKSYRWPAEWKTGQPFNNCFWIRNPNMIAGDLLDYEGKTEIRVLPRRVAQLAKQKSEYLNNDTVRRHFRDPAAAWDAAFTLRDGGVTYLANAVAPVCNPMLKAQQIQTRLYTLRTTMRERLQRYFVSDDQAEQRRTRKAAAEVVVENLICCAGDQRFGGLMRALQTSDTALSDVFVTLVNQRGLPGGQRIDKTSMRDLLGLKGMTSPGTEIRDAADAYANAAIEHWNENIRSLANNPRVCRHFRMEQRAMTELVDELIAGSARLDLRSRIAKQIRPTIRPHPSVKDQVVQPSFLAADTIGAFVFTLGYDWLPEAERPMRIGGGQSRVFDAPQTADNSSIGEQPTSFEQRFCTDWFQAYLDFVDRNASSDGGRRINIEQNARLGAILGKLGQVHMPATASAS